MHRLLSWLLIAAFTLSACASGAPPPVETDTETSEADRLPEVLSSCKPGDRIEVWAKSGECFEATFEACDSTTLSVADKSYEHVYQRDDHGYRNQTRYQLAELARVRAAPFLSKSAAKKLTLGGIAISVAAVAGMTVLGTLVWLMVGLNYH